MEKALLEPVVSKILDEMRLRPIPLGVSNRHLHLSVQDYQQLFPEQPLIEKKALLQPGQFAAAQTVTLVGPKGSLKNVRILGPLRSYSQVEISRTDARTLGINAPLRMSGNLDDTPAIRLVSPDGELELPKGVIVALRHIHMSPLDALIYRVKHGDRVQVAIHGSGRRLIMDDVAIRVSPQMKLEMHIDTDEANAAGADDPAAFATLLPPSRTMQP
ncbi:putative propanediol utilization protein [Yersinia aldovae]|uniref:phosphate propanoyltransferase n=1 Tax=Yersinia aldovae TaxID=29483 RepID=UPI0005E96725|nr:phosphate propanoyltransferase [Yersinia aldovae]CNH05151.1 putative propanediol utilization protein [Yersinia aldovae]